MTERLRSKLDYALALAAAGYAVFPGVTGAKRPAVTAWQQWATTDPAKLKAHWSMHPDHNPCIATGRYNGAEHLLALDIDVKGSKRGDVALRALETKHGALPETFEQRSPTGGTHKLYRVPGPLRNGVDVLGVGIDTRGAGGYVVAAGSETEAGAYTAERIAPPAPAPQWLIDLCARPAEHGPARAGEVLPGIDAPSAAQRVAHYLTVEAKPAIEGEGGDAQTLATAMRCKDLGADEATCCALMLEHYNGRCVPPWTPEELEAKVRNAYRYGKQPAGSAAPEAVFPPITDAEPKPAKPTGRALKLRAFSDIRAELDQLWLIDDVLAASSMALLYAKPNEGKSFVAIDMGMAIARGTPWHDRQTVRGTVLYVASEGRIANRVEAQALHHGLDRSKIPFFVIEEPLRLFDARADVEPLIVAAKQAALAAGEPLRLVVIDTLASVFGGGDENTGKDMGALLANVARVQHATNSAVLLIHHHGKDQSRGARGHSSLEAAIDTGLEIKESVISVEKQRDGRKGDRFGFQLVTVPLGVSKRGKRIESCVAVPVSAGALRAFSKGRIKAGSVAALALETLENLTLIENRVSVLAWQEAFAQAHYRGSKPKTAAKAFDRALATLRAAHRINLENDHAAISE